MDVGLVVDGRFLLAERVAAGGMGVVFRAVDQTTGESVAFKVLDGRDARDIERARREAEVLARLAHPAVVRHVASGTTSGGAAYLAMAWIEGVTVANRLLAEGFSLAEAIAVLRRVADGLASAHREQILHRDIKPANVILIRNQPDEAMLIDFGVARVGDAVQALTRTGMAVGTPGYMSPEQARGDRELTPAADVFGLGCLVYECATGTPAFSGTLPSAVLAKILLSAPVPLQVACPEAPAGIVRLVERMLAKSVADRLHDCAEVIAAIDAIGPIPRGPRRASSARASDATQVVSTPASHCLVAASHGSPDDVLAPPTTGEYARLADVADVHAAKLEITATGALIAHVTGDERDAAHRAANLALAIREILTGWTIAISAVRPASDVAIDSATSLLSGAAMAAIFKRPGSGLIALDPKTAKLVSDAFEIQPGREPKLLGKRS